MGRRYTTRTEDAAYILRRLADAHRSWKVGDACLSYDLRSETTIARIEGEIAHLANGDHCHVSKVRSIGSGRTQ